MAKFNPAKRTILLSRGIFILMLSLAIFNLSTNPNRPQVASRVENGLLIEKWSEQKVQDLRAEGRIVFVNFTADWCITCKVNENSAFKNEKAKQKFKDKNVAYLIADWTKKDETIARALSSHGRIGVPLYLVYLPNQPEPVVLPQLLSSQTIIEALE